MIKPGHLSNEEHAKVNCHSYHAGHGQLGMVLIMITILVFGQWIYIENHLCNNIISHTDKHIQLKIDHLLPRIKVLSNLSKPLFPVAI